MVIYNHSYVKFEEKNEGKKRKETDKHVIGKKFIECENFQKKLNKREKLQGEKNILLEQKR